jgi:hypothetical protein
MSILPPPSLLAAGALVLALGCAETQPRAAETPAPTTDASPAPMPQPPSAGVAGRAGVAGSAGVAVSAGAAGSAGDAGLAGSADDAGVTIDPITPGEPPEPPGECYLGPLDCEKQDCDDYEPMETECSGEPGWPGARFDDECGDYRYRFDGTTYGGTVLIWERASGKLVVHYWFTDYVPSGCRTSLSGDRDVFEQCDVASWADVCPPDAN